MRCIFKEIIPTKATKVNQIVKAVRTFEPGKGKEMSKKRVEEKSKEVMNAPVIQPEVMSEFKKRCQLITRELKKVESSFLNIGFSLHWIYRTGAYQAMNYDTVYSFAKDKFGIARGTCNNFINVVETFGKKVDNNTFIEELDEKYRSFSSSQLIALLGYINRGGQELDCFTSDMSVREIKSLIKDKENPVEECGEDVVDVESVTVSPESVSKVLISCSTKEDYDKKVDDIDFLICNAFAKAKGPVRIEIVCYQ